MMLYVSAEPLMMYCCGLSSRYLLVLSLPSPRVLSTDPISDLVDTECPRNDRIFAFSYFCFQMNLPFYGTQNVLLVGACT